jgi:hypothetical protein
VVASVPDVLSDEVSLLQAYTKPRKLKTMSIFFMSLFLKLADKITWQDYYHLKQNNMITVIKETD